MRGTNFLLATMALSALVLIGITSTAGSTTATFTATTTNPGNTFQTATLMISNDKPNAGTSSTSRTSCPATRRSASCT